MMQLDFNLDAYERFLSGIAAIVEIMNGIQLKQQVSPPSEYLLGAGVEAPTRGNIKAASTPS